MKWMDALKRRSDLPSDTTIGDDLSTLESEFPGVEFDIRYYGFHVCYQAKLAHGVVSSHPITKHNRLTEVERFGELLARATTARPKPVTVASDHQSGFYATP